MCFTERKNPPPFIISFFFCFSSPWEKPQGNHHDITRSCFFLFFSFLPFWPFSFGRFFYERALLKNFNTDTQKNRGNWRLFVNFLIVPFLRYRLAVVAIFLRAFIIRRRSIHFFSPSYIFFCPSITWKTFRERRRGKKKWRRIKRCYEEEEGNVYNQDSRDRCVFAG